jgi:diguanylate cyclase (GGDEF)-like protein
VTDANGRDAMDRKKTPILSIRARLGLLALIAVVPLLLDRVHSLEAHRTERLKAAQSEAMELARRGAENHAETVKSVRSLLQVFAHSGRIARGLRHECEPLVNSARSLPWLRSLSLADAEGRIVCSTHARLVDVDLTDRAYFREAGRTGAFTLSDYLIGRMRHRPTIIAAQPVLDDDRGLRAMLIATIDLTWMERLIGSVGRRDGASIALIDGHGMLIARHPEAPQSIGSNLFEYPIVRTMLARDDGMMSGNGIDGVSRIFGFVRVPETQSRLAVGLDERSILSGIDAEIGRAYLQLGLFAVLALFAAWIGGERLIVDPIRALARTATRVGRGEMDTRLPREGWVAEFKPLVEAFDDMTQRLAVRDRELRAANRHFEELASIDGLCGLANRRAFDGRLEDEWQRAIKTRRPLGLLLFDIDRFKAFNDGCGHLEGDNCLRQVGEALASVATGSGDVAARFGGDEFALLLPGADEPHAIAVAERLRKAIQTLRIARPGTGPGPAHVTISIGAAASIPESCERPESLVAAADQALYVAKQNGRDAVIGHRGIALAQAG